MQIRHMETLMLCLYDSFTMFTADQEWDHAVRIAQTRLCEALMRQHQGRNYCLQEWMKDALHTPYGEWWAAIWMDHNRNAFSVCLRVFQLWMNVILRAGVKVKESVKFRLAHMNGIDHSSTHESNGKRARVKQTVWSDGHQSTPHPLTTVCPPFRLPPWPGSTQLKHFSLDN